MQILLLMYDPGGFRSSTTSDPSVQKKSSEPSTQQNNDRYRTESLGRMAAFLVPSVKLQQQTNRGKTFEQVIREFLISRYGGYTQTAGSISGYWRDQAGALHYGEHREFKVGFLGKDRIPELKEFLARIASEMKEQCMYLETGEDAMLVFPVPKQV